jgi:RNA polymerase sigma factor (sigma-70 family)
MQEAVRSGVPEAVSRDIEFSELYLRTYRRMVMLAYATVGSLALAEEIAQDAFGQLYRRWPLIETKEAWVRRAVISLATSWLRRQLLERRHPPDPSAAADWVEGAHLRMMLGVLSRRQRAAVILRFYEGLTEREIARALRCRPGTVKSLLSRALDALREEHRHADRS